MAGPPMCVILKSGDGYVVLVTSVISKSWRKLPACPDFEHPTYIWDGAWEQMPDPAKILPWGPDGYRVIFVRGLINNEEGAMCTQMYDSKLNVWTGEEFSGEDHDWPFCGNTAYLDGKLYCMHTHLWKGPKLWVYAVAKESWAHNSSALQGEMRIIKGGVLRCGDKVMVVLCYLANEGDAVYFKIYELILDALHFEDLCLRYLATGLPAPYLSSRQIYAISFTSGSNFVYMGDMACQSLVGRHTGRSMCILTSGVFFHQLIREWAASTQMMPSSRV